MKSIEVPETIALIDPMTGKPAKTTTGEPATWTFRQWVVLGLLNDERARGDVDATARLYTHILPLFGEDLCVPGAKILLEDADYARLAPIALSTRPLVQNVLMDAQLAPFSMAFRGAKDVSAAASVESTNGSQARRARA